MPKHLVSITAAVVCTLALIQISCTAYPRDSGAPVIGTPAAHTAAPGVVAVSPNADPIPCYSVLELTFKHNGIYGDKFLDVDLKVVFTSPNGTQYRVKGFFYDNDLWKVRFRPDEPGHWTYTFILSGNGGFRFEGNGKFDSIPSVAEGPIHRNPQNPYRWIFANGKPYFPIGLQDCVSLEGSQVGQGVIDGEKRDDNKARHIPMADYFSIYGEAGFNLFRFSPNNCSYPLFDDLDHYRQAESMATDDLLSLARRHGFRIMFGFFGSYDSPAHHPSILRSFQFVLLKPFGAPDEALWNSDQLRTIAKERRFVDYCIARWGVYVDFWELLNETEASDEWATMMANYARSVDPDRKPISTSWEKPHLPGIDINAPHWYESESELQSDLRVQQQAAEWKQAGKPVVVGEQGNTGMNWDPLSGLRMRVRIWTALFQEIGLVFWNTSWSKAGMFQGVYTPGAAANLYLGPEERGYTRVLKLFSSRLDAGVRMAPVKVSDPSRVRAYALVSSTVAAVYLHHFADHTRTIGDLNIALQLAGESRSASDLIGEWIDPSTGNVIARTQVSPGMQGMDVPPFMIDLALLITAAPNRATP